MPPLGRAQVNSGQSCGHVKVVKVLLAGGSRMWLPKVHPSKAWRGQHQPLCDPHICTICPGMPGDAMVWPPGYRSRQGDLTPRPWQGRRQSCPVPLTTSSTFTISYTRFTATNGHSAQGEAHRRQMLTAAPANLNTTPDQRGSWKRLKIRHPGADLDSCSTQLLPAMSCTISGLRSCSCCWRRSKKIIDGCSCPGRCTPPPMNRMQCYYASPAQARPPQV